MKKVVVVFDFEHGTQEMYDQVWDEIRASGNENPKGLIYHVGAPKPNGGWLVVDVWESEQAFQEFGNVLMPIMKKVDAPPTQPQIYPVHNIYQEQKQTAF
jgi:hypothetical protein